MWNVENSECRIRTTKGLIVTSRNEKAKLPITAIWQQIGSLLHRGLCFHFRAGEWEKVKRKRAEAGEKRNKVRGRSSHRAPRFPDFPFFAPPPVFSPFPHRRSLCRGVRQIVKTLIVTSRNEKPKLAKHPESVIQNKPRFFTAYMLSNTAYPLKYCP